MIDGIGDWADLPFFAEGTFDTVMDRVASDPREILPPKAEILAAFKLTPRHSVRVVILGQDPYPTPGHAHGLAFSVEPSVTPLPRSLQNIFKELSDDLGVAPQNGDLRFWARQGVLLLNSALTVPSGEADGHAKLGWAELTPQVLEAVSTRPTAFLLWGKKAAAHRAAIGGDGHLIVETAHPSPLSARRGFFGSKPFSKINAWLADMGEPAINWAQSP